MTRPPRDRETSTRHPSVVSYLPPPPFAWSDLPYFLLRWSKGWSRASLRHFDDKWRLAAGDRHLAYLTHHRRLVFRPLRDWIATSRGRRNRAM